MNNNFLLKEIFKLELNLETNNLILILWGYPRESRIFLIKIYQDSLKILIYWNQMKNIINGLIPIETTYFIKILLIPMNLIFKIIIN